MEVASPLAALVPSALVAGAGSNKKRALASCSPGSSSSLSSSSSSSSLLGMDAALKSEQGTVGGGADAAASNAAALLMAPSLATASGYPRIWQPSPLGSYQNASHGGSSGQQHHSKRMRLFHRSNNNEDASVDALSERFSSHSPFLASQKAPQRSGIDGLLSSPSLYLHPPTANPDAARVPQAPSGSELASVAPAPSSASISEISAASRASETAAVATSAAAASSSSAALPQPHAVVAAERSLRIEALQQDKTRLESELGEAKVALERSRKESSVLRRAVAIQQDRHKQNESQLARALREKAEADEKIRALEQMVVALRYHHWQASSSSHPHASEGGTMHDFMGGMPPRPPDVF